MFVNTFKVASFCILFMRKFKIGKKRFELKLPLLYFSFCMQDRVKVRIPDHSCIFSDFIPSIQQTCIVLFQDDETKIEIKFGKTTKKSSFSLFLHGVSFYFLSFMI